MLVFNFSKISFTISQKASCPLTFQSLHYLCKINDFATKSKTKVSQQCELAKGLVMFCCCQFVSTHQKRRICVIKMCASCGVVVQHIICIACWMCFIYMGWVCACCIECCLLCFLYVHSMCMLKFLFTILVGLLFVCFCCCFTHFDNSNFHCLAMHIFRRS